MKVWMSENTKQNNYYAIRLLGAIVGCVILGLALTFGSIWFTLYMGWSIQIVGLGVCYAVPALIVLLIMRISKALHRDTLIFCQDDNDSLFVINAEMYARGGRGLAGITRKAVETQQVLEKFKQNRILEKHMSQEKSLHGLEIQIVSVEKLKATWDGHVAACNVRYPNGNCGKQTYIINKGYEREDELLSVFERKRYNGGSPEVKENKNPVGIMISLLALLACVVLCALSHPAVGRLPQVIYFPCLGLAHVPLCLLVHFIIKQNRS